MTRGEEESPFVVDLVADDVAPDGPPVTPSDAPLDAPPEKPPDESVGAAVEAERWVGSPLVPYEVGEPGRATREVVPALGGDPADPADINADDASPGRLVARAASARGTSHRHAATPRQDDYALCAAGDGRWLVAAVADGVSARALSHQAATIACRTGAALLRDAPPTPTISRRSPGRTSSTAPPAGSWCTGSARSPRRPTRTTGLRTRGPSPD